MSEMKRKPGSLFPLELAVLQAGLDLAAHGEHSFYGYAVAKAVAAQSEARRLTAHGTLYRALDRMEDAGLLESILEDPDVAAAARRPRRRMFSVTANGQSVLADARSAARVATATLRTEARFS